MAFNAGGWLKSRLGRKVSAQSTGVKFRRLRGERYARWLALWGGVQPYRLALLGMGRWVQCCILRGFQDARQAEMKGIETLP